MAGFFKKALGVFVDVEGAEGGEDLLTAEDLDDEARALLAAIEGGAHSPPPPPPGEAYAEQAAATHDAAQTDPGLSAGLAPGQDLPSIYAAAGVPDSPYSAEMLIRVAEGLRALPLAQARAAVDAMDSADDRWTVGDVMLDAERKIAALKGVEATMQGQRTEAEAAFERQSAAIDEVMAETQAEVQKQIAELEALLAEAQETATVERAKALSELEATRAACTGEISRLEAESKRLSQVFEFLGD